jgi:hypothetical protein
LVNMIRYVISFFSTINRFCYLCCQ